MKLKFSFSYIKQSIFARLTLMLIAILLLLFYQIVVAPIVSAFSLSKGKFDVYTVNSQIETLINQQHIPFDKLASNSDFKKIAASNPDLRLFIQAGVKEFKYGGEPKLFNFPDIPKIESRKAERQDKCLLSGYGTVHFIENKLEGEVSYTNCGGYVQYKELVGITPTEFSQWQMLEYYINEIKQHSYGRGDDFILFILAILFLSLITILQAGNSLKKITKEAKSIDFSKSNEHLSDKGIPVEIKPLVKAINDMLDRIAEAHEKQEFFLAAAAHELRTPLTILRARLEGLDDNEVKTELLDDVYDMSNLVNQLLRLNHVQSSTDLVRDEINLSELVEKVCANRAPLAINNGIELELSIPEGSVTIFGDSAMISLALSNIIDNALAVSKAGQNVEVNVVSNGEVQVRDYGPGVPEDMQKTLFEPFTKHPSNQLGHGLGLAIVSAIMKLFNGSVTCESKVNSGTTFTLKFPI